MECSLCKQGHQTTKDNKPSCITCDTCKNLICLECSELSASEIRCISLQKRILKFQCKKCRNFELVDILQNTIIDKTKIIQDQELIIKLLQEKINDIGKNQMNTKSYASAINDNKEKHEVAKVPYNFPKVVLKPKNNQSAEVTMKDLNSKLNPLELKLGITNMKKTKNGAIIIKCQTKDETHALKVEMEKKLHQSYEVEMTKLIEPKIKIVNFNQEMTNDEIENSIKQQNHLDGKIKVKYINRAKPGPKSIICECSPSAFHQIMNMKKLCIGWERHRVYEDLSIPKCFNCQGFFHKKNNCTSKLVCSYCSEEHQFNECNKVTASCKNCIISNNKYKTKYSTNHRCDSEECSTLNYHINVMKSKINYAINA